MVTAMDKECTTALRQLLVRSDAGGQCLLALLICAGSITGTTTFLSRRPRFLYTSLRCTYLILVRASLLQESASSLLLNVLHNRPSLTARFHFTTLIVH